VSKDIVRALPVETVICFKGLLTRATKLSDFMFDFFGGKRLEVIRRRFCDLSDEFSSSFFINPYFKAVKCLPIMSSVASSQFTNLKLRGATKSDCCSRPRKWTLKPAKIRRN
jgi:hypothetical protein